VKAGLTLGEKDHQVSYVPHQRGEREKESHYWIKDFEGGGGYSGTERKVIFAVEENNGNGKCFCLAREKGIRLKAAIMGKKIGKKYRI